MNKKYKWFLFSFILNIFISFELILLLSLDEDIDSAVMSFLFISGVSLISLVVGFYISKLWKPLWPIFISIFISFSLLELKLIYLSEFANLKNIWLLVIIISVWLLLHTLITRTKIFELPTLGLYVSSFFVLVCSPILALQLQNTEDTKLSTSETTFLNQLSKVKFKDKPNVYILFYDSMIPPLTARKYLGIERLGYDAVLEKDFIRLLPSATVRAPSKPSLNGLMRLDQKIMEKGYVYFNGKKISPLAKLFSSNGYRVTTGYKSYYFGLKGPYIDRYVILTDRPLSSSTQCIDVGNSPFQRLRSFGICELLGKYSINHLTRLIERRGLRVKLWPEQVYEEIQSGAKSNRPELKIFYTYRPNGHTKMDYRHSDLQKRKEYKKYFNEGDRRLSIILEDLVALIKSEDPKSLVLVAGDHGAYLSRGLKKEKDPKFYMEDIHMIDSAIMATQHPCANKERLFNESPGYFTPSRIVVSLVNCLAGNQSLSELLNFEEPTDLVEIVKNYKD